MPSPFMRRCAILATRSAHKSTHRQFPLIFILSTFYYSLLSSYGQEVGSSLNETQKYRPAKPGTGTSAENNPKKEMEGVGKGGSQCHLVHFYPGVLSLIGLTC